MATMTASEIQEKQARRLKESIPDIERGIDRVTVAPSVNAVKAIPKMKAKIIEALDNGKYERGVMSVSLEEWKHKTKAKGLGRIAVGIDEAKDKTTKFFGQLLEHQAQNKTKLDAMPTTTLQDSINKMTANVQHMAKMSFNKSA